MLKSARIPDLRHRCWRFRSRARLSPLLRGARHSLAAIPETPVIHPVIHPALPITKSVVPCLVVKLPIPRLVVKLPMPTHPSSRGSKTPPVRPVAAVVGPPLEVSQVATGQEVHRVSLGAVLTPRVTPYNPTMPPQLPQRRSLSSTRSA